ncbi:MAG: pre-peptidase C-terminal domain-containing protein [Phycisphaeraceae bacterium]|nr:MAG: pre-peptidase C-terminal domain-containing protein [Phycisphaeraceae bacterium]
MKMIAVLGGVLAAAGSAQAGFFVEVESNDTLATANFVGSYSFPGDGFVVDGAISPSTDEDWFRFSVDDATQIRVAIFGRPNSSSGDSFLELFDGAGSLVASDDDSGINLFSALEYNTAGAGTYFLRVTSFRGASSFEYKMVVGLNVAPTPGSLALAGLGALVATRRRRA